MNNAKIIHIDENVFKENSNKNKLNNSRINNITIIRIDDDVYAGEVKDGKPHVKGIWKYYHEGKAEGRYVGGFKDGKRDGEGKWIMDDYSYEGEWKLDKFHGAKVNLLDLMMYKKDFGLWGALNAITGMK
jgi:hypothetical protein